jgi:capsular polysaccharide biosynthesis protein
MLVAGAVSYALPPTYRASSIVALGNFDDTIYTSQDSARAIMLSDEYLLDVIDQLSFDVPQKKFWDFKDSIKISAVKGSNLLVISAESKKKQEAKEIVETMIGHFANISKESYDKHYNIISGNLANIQERLEPAEKDAQQTRNVLLNMGNTTAMTSTGDELEVLRSLDTLNSIESRRSNLLDREIDLKNKLVLFSNLEVIQGTKEPVSPRSERILILTIAGMLGLMVGVLAAFLRQSLKKPR